MIVIKQIQISTPLGKMRHTKNILFVLVLLAAWMDVMTASCPVCSFGWIESAETATCLKFSDDKLNWHEARAVCNAEAADLVKIVNDSMNQFIAGQVSAHIGLSFWTGLHDTEQEGLFLWLNESEEGEYFSWADDQPDNFKQSLQDEDCVDIMDNGEWNDQYCTTKANYICEKALNPAIAAAMDDPSCDGCSTKELHFQQQDPLSLDPYRPNRLTSSGWSGLSSVGACAVMSIMKFPNSTAFLYNSETELCSPLLRMEFPRISTVPAVMAREGDLYLVNHAGCTGRFKLMELRTGEMVCLWYVTEFVNYYSLTKSFCAAMGSYLVSVKTLAKLELIRTLTGGHSVWVGLDRKDTGGTLVWASDGEALTAQQEQELFSNGQPSYGDHKCAVFVNTSGKLVDYLCNAAYMFICEKNVTLTMGA